ASPGVSDIRGHRLRAAQDVQHGPGNIAEQPDVDLAIEINIFYELYDLIVRSGIRQAHERGIPGRPHFTVFIGQTFRIVFIRCAAACWSLPESSQSQGSVLRPTNKV